TSITLDAPVTVTAPGSKVALRMPDGSWAERYIVENSGTYDSISWVTPLAELPLPGAIWMLSEQNVQPVLARVLGVKEGDDKGVFEVVCVEHNPSKFDAIEKGIRLEEPKTS